LEGNDFGPGIGWHGGPRERRFVRHKERSESGGSGIGPDPGIRV
jgi:hypothetical protein